MSTSDLHPLLILTSYSDPPGSIYPYWAEILSARPESQRITRSALSRPSLHHSAWNCGRSTCWIAAAVRDMKTNGGAVDRGGLGHIGHHTAGQQHISSFHTSGCCSTTLCPRSGALVLL